MSDVSSPIGDGSPEVPHRARRLGRRRAGALGLLDQPGREAGAVPGAVRRPDPGRRDVLREHLHRVRGRLRRCTCGRARAGRSSSRAIPSTRSTRASCAPAARRRSRACTTRAGSRRPMARGQDGQFTAISWDDAIARFAAKVTEAGGKLAVLSGAGRGTFSDLLAEWAGAAGGRVVRWEPFDHEPIRAANRQVFGLDQLPAHDFASAKYILSFGADFLDTWLSPTEHQRGFATSHGFGEGDVAKFVYASPRQDLTGLNADEWLAVRPGTEAALALAMANAVATARGAALPGRPRQVHARGGRAGNRRACRADRADRARVRGREAEPGGRGRRRRAARRRDRALRRGQPAQFRRRQHRQDRQVRRRPGRRPTATARSSDLTKAIDGGQVALARWCTTPTRSTRCPRPPGFAEQAQEGAVQGLDVALPRRDRRPVRPPAAAEPRARAVGRSRAARRRAEPDAAGDGAGVRHPRRGRHPAAGRQEGGRRAGQVHRADVGGPPPRAAGRALAGERKAATPASSGARRCSAAALRRGAGRRPRWRSRRARRSWRYTKPAFEGKGEFVFLAYPHGMLHDGRGDQQAVAARERRPGDQDHLAPLGRGRARDRAPPRHPERRDPPSHLAPRRGRRPGLHPSRPARRGGRHAARLRAHRLRGVRRRAGRQRARPARRTGRRLPALCLDPGHAREDRRLPPARHDRGRAAPARPGHRRGDAARGGQEGTHRQAGVPRGRARRARGEHRARGGGAQGLERDPAPDDAQGRLRPRAPAVGHGDRPGPLHRVPGLRHRLLRREQHPDRRRAGGPPGPGDDLDPDRALLGGRGSRRRRRPGSLRPDALPALRQRAVRAGVPGLRGLPHGRRSQRPGVQPVRRHALLRQQLPVQGAVLQLVQVQRPRLAGAAPPPAQPRRHRAGARRDGEVHVLHPAHPRRAEPGAARGSAGAGRRVHHRLRPGLSIRRDRLRRRQESRRAASPRSSRTPGAITSWKRSTSGRRSPTSPRSCIRWRPDQWLSSHVPAPPGSPSWSSPRRTRTSPATSSRPWRSPPPATSCCCWARLRCSWWGC